MFQHTNCIKPPDCEKTHYCSIVKPLKQVHVGLIKLSLPFCHENPNRKSAELRN